jgi:CDP-glycerol glycerophosphotransferase (TagB/SpsB family)
LDLIKEAADIVVSDISSLLYEAMALGKLVAFDGNRTLYEESGAGHILQSMDDFLFQCSWCSDLSSQFASLLENTKSHELQAEFIQGYVYNIENAADISFELTKKLVE